ncbi:cytidylate kinase [Moraxella bovoculi]|uniref:Cytidylate kinase n=1 Tax=Moraxella bovoculi TaxID=386891 RepID=A0AAC8PWG0_9GAMM|nr:(d)CMP kinase [Moraxella bovoculi]AKG07647.1 cytidylate kinase [Moraxella bovoculi]AKG11669.1 cytidylate kinase [Moraxella bovoculi]
MTTPKSITPKIITIDGLSGAGKGTVAYRLAEHFGFELLDSGALYRIVGLMAFKNGLLNSTEIDEQKVAKLTQSLNLSFRPNTATKTVEILVDNTPLTDDIRNEVVGGYASRVAVLPSVRTVLFDLQKNMAKDRVGLVADGRDMGAVIFPDAPVKVFLIASAKVRAERRVLQLQTAGKVADYEAILVDIIERDERDENRAVAPSRPAVDALVIDSSDKSADVVFDEILAFTQGKL